MIQIGRHAVRSLVDRQQALAAQALPDALLAHARAIGLQMLLDTMPTIRAAAADVYLGDLRIQKCVLADAFAG